MTDSASPVDIEQPACFYLGSEYDLAGRKSLDRPVMYDARDLTTHGVVVGMTGSGKTGLSINLLEEAAIDGIPCIIIDPKGDLPNLLLQFPDLKPDDFTPWINADDARQKGVSLEDHAKRISDTWRLGLSNTGQTPERIAKLRDAGEWRVYTPGSEAGLPLSLLGSFTAPKGEVSREALNEKIDATTTALLGLSGISADPVQSREHILIAQLLLHSWKKGKDLDLRQLIAQIQVPPMSTVGAFDVETFFPEKERLRLAVALNNILAAPSFSTWITGEALDLSKMLSGGKKPRHLIFYIAHLEDSQRMFFLTLLLEEILSWTRKQSGSSNLRAIVYFDEVFGYLPPHPANPPTKQPLMTLMKQARAFGVGVLLATQNPVDLDYKALSNAGTWFVGKLQTERDKARLIEGLEGVAAERGTLTDRAYLENVISALGNRTFLLHDVHRQQPVLFQTRWALSYLGGPLTRDQVAQLMKDRKEAEGATEQAPEDAAESAEEAGELDIELEPAGKGEVTAAPQVAAGVSQFYLPVNAEAPAGGLLLYQPRVLGFASVTFSDKKKGVQQRRDYRFLGAVPASGAFVAWESAEPLREMLAVAPEAGARWAELPEVFESARKVKALEKAFADFLYGSVKLVVRVNAAVGLASEPGEDAAAFQQRCRKAAEGKLAEEVTALKAKHRAKFEAAKLTFPDEEEKQGKSLLGSVFGMLTSSSEPAGKQAIKEQQKRDKLLADYDAARNKLVQKWQQASTEASEVILKPRKADVQVTHFGLAWAPFWQTAGGRTAAYR